MTDLNNCPTKISLDFDTMWNLSGSRGQQSPTQPKVNVFNQKRFPTAETWRCPQTCVLAAWLKAAMRFLFWEHRSQCQLSPCLFFTATHVVKAAKTISLLLLSHAEEKHLALVIGRWLNMDFWMIAGHAQGSRSCSPLRAAIHHLNFHAHLLPLSFWCTKHVARKIGRRINTPVNFIGCLQFGPWLHQVAIWLHKIKIWSSATKTEGTKMAARKKEMKVLRQRAPGSNASGIEFGMAFLFH